MNHYLRYEHLEEDIQALDVGGLFERFSSIRTKADHRPKTGATAKELFAKHPRAVDIVAEECQDVINRFGYAKPLTKPADVAPRKDETDHSIFTITRRAYGDGMAEAIPRRKPGHSVGFMSPCSPRISAPECPISAR